MNKRLLIVAICILCLFCLLCLLYLFGRNFNTGTDDPHLMETADDDAPVALVADVLTVEAELHVRDRIIPVKGKFNLYLKASRQKLKDGLMDVEGFNLLFFDVEQAAISGKDAAMEKATLSVSSTGNATMKFDDDEWTSLSGDIPVQAYFPQIDELLPPISSDDREYNYTTISQTQLGTMRLNITFPQSLHKYPNILTVKHLTKIDAQSFSTIKIGPLGSDSPAIPDYRIETRKTPFRAEVASLDKATVGKHLCIQPVSIRRSDTDRDPTGEGQGKGYENSKLAIRNLWINAGIKIEPDLDSVSWMRITNPDWITPNKKQVREMLSHIDGGGCIAIIFVHGYLDGSLDDGGGKTNFAPGGASKIISSDLVATTQNPTHLAHELGHALGLGHPQDPMGLFDSTRGTLMCPSGRFDNPEKNSLPNVNFAKTYYTTIGEGQVPVTLRFCCSTEGCSCDACE